jgi:hypothetical protein
MIFNLLVSWQLSLLREEFRKEFVRSCLVEEMSQKFAEDLRAINNVRPATTRVAWGIIKTKNIVRLTNLKN